jgi:hypothetical protein
LFAVHSTTDREHPEKVKDSPLKGGLEFAMGPIATTYAPNLTPHAETGIGKNSDGDLARVIRTGVRPDGRLSFFMSMAASKPSDEDLVAIVSYLRSLAPIDNRVADGEWKPLGNIIFSMSSLGPSSAPPPGTFPRRMSPASSAVATSEATDAVFVVSHGLRHGRHEVHRAGGRREPSRSEPRQGQRQGVVAPNLTSDPTGITGRMDETTFVARIRSGRVFASSIMPWESFQLTTESDLRSVYRYSSRWRP